MIGAALLLGALGAGAVEIPAVARDPDVEAWPRERAWDTGWSAPAFLDVTTGRADPTTRAVLVAGPRHLSVLFTCGERGKLALARPPREAGASIPLDDQEDVRLEVRGGGGNLRFTVGALGDALAVRLRSDGTGEPLPAVSWAGASRVAGRTWWAEIGVPWEVLGVVPGGPIQVKLSRASWVAVAGRIVRHVFVSGGPRGDREDATGFLTLRRPDHTPVAPPPELAWIAGPGPEPLSAVPLRQPGHVLLVRGDRWAAFARVHAANGLDPVSVSVEGAGQGVSAEAFVCPRWPQAGRSSFVEVDEEGGQGDVLVRELLLKSPEIPPERAPRDGEPVRLRLAPDEDQLLVLRLRVDGAAPAGERQLALIVEPGLDGQSRTRLSLPVEVLPLEARPAMRWGTYLHRFHAGDVAMLHAAGFTDAVVDVAGASAEGRRALVEHGLQVVTMGLPASLDTFRPVVPSHAYGVDEPFTEGEHAACRDLFARIRGMGLRTTTALTRRESLAWLAPLLDRAIINTSLLSGLPPKAPGDAERWAYWQILREDLARHRLLAGLHAWAMGLDGVMPYAWMDAAGDPWDDWDGDGMRDHVAVYPVGDGRIATLQLLGMEMAMGDVAAVGAAERAADGDAPGAGGGVGWLLGFPPHFSRPYLELLYQRPMSAADAVRQELLRRARR